MANQRTKNKLQNGPIKMKQMFTLLLCCLFIWASSILAEVTFPQKGNPRYSEVEIYLQQPAKQFKQLALKGLIFDHIKVLGKNGGGLHFKTVINDYEFNILKESNINFKILIPDVVQNFKERQRAMLAKTTSNESLPAGFEYGSMGGYYTFEEVERELDSLHLNYPALASSKQSIGTSYENRNLWMVKISDHVDQDEQEPEVLFTALHHAREPGGLMTLMYFLDDILEKYGSDPEITYLIDHRQIFAVPVVNPDGYVYNEQTNPDGGGQWRKNRKPVQNWYGVDLNRNYGYQWGYDDQGSSPFPFSDTYRGEAPFSELETQAIRDFTFSRNFKCVMNFHTYGQVFIYPWSYINALTPDSLPFMEFANVLTRNNHYNFGNTYQTINYNANGDADDWFYGEQNSKAKIFACTPELGGDSDGFWPPQDRIVPICKKNQALLLYYTWLAGFYPQAFSYQIIFDDNANGFPEPGEQVKIVCLTKNIGLSEGQNVTLTLRSDVAGIVSSTQPLHTVWPMNTTFNDTFLLSIDNDVPEGSFAWLMVDFDLGSYTLTDTVGSMIIGTPIIVFKDDAENGLDNWQTGQSWGIENDTLSNNNLAFSDSPYSQYQNDADNILSLKQPLQLPQADFIYLGYQTHWDIERAFDFATVEVSSDGQSWHTLQSNWMLQGSGKGQQANSSTGYDGFYHYWLQEWIDISNYQTNDNLYLRFRLQSDGGVSKDGWYLDDIQVLAYNTIPSAIAQTATNVPFKLGLQPAYPNPFNAHTTIRFTLNQKRQVELSVFNLTGQKIATLFEGWPAIGQHQFVFKADDLASGIYFVKLQAGNVSRIQKIILIK